MSPPTKNSEPNAANVRSLEVWLSSILAFHAGSAGRPWTFYEEVDKYLGPWGDKGYPISYGKKYCELFSQDEKLNANAAGAAWVRRTLTLLQEALKDFILQRYRERKLAKLTEAEFRQAAFDSHPKAYTDGGLTMVAMLSPDLVVHLASIPAVEFLPTSPSFGATVAQVFSTAGMVVPRGVGLLLAGFAGPAHTGSLRRAFAMDRAQFAADMNRGLALNAASRAVVSGACDNVALLDRLAQAVATTQLSDRSEEITARAVLTQISARRALVVQRYQREIRVDSGLREVFRAFDPQAF